LQKKPPGLRQSALADIIPRVGHIQEERIHICLGKTVGDIAQLEIHASIQAERSRFLRARAWNSGRRSKETTRPCGPTA